MRQPRQRFADRNGALSRRIDQHAVELAEFGEIQRGRLEQVTTMETCLFRHAVGAGIFQRPLSQHRTAFDTHHFARLGGQR